MSATIMCMDLDDYEEEVEETPVGRVRSFKPKPERQWQHNPEKARPVDPKRWWKLPEEP